MSPERDEGLIHLERRPIPGQLRRWAQYLREVAEGIEAEKHGQLYGVAIGLEVIADELEAG